MNSKRVPAGVKTFTEFTGDGLIARRGMRTQMGCQGGLECKAFITYFTIERPFSSMRSHVTNKIGLFSNQIKNQYISRLILIISLLFFT